MLKFIIFILFAVVIGAFIITSVRISRREKEHQKGDFHRRVASGEYQKQMRKERRQALKVKSKRNKKGKRRY